MKRKTAPAPPLKPGLPGRRKFWLASACAVSLLVAFVSAIFGTGCVVPLVGERAAAGGSTTKDPYTEQQIRISTFREAIVYWESRGEQDTHTMSQVVESGLGVPFHRDFSHDSGRPVYLSPSGITSIHISRNRVVVSGPSVPPETKGSVEQLAAAITAAARASGLVVR